MPLDDVEAMLGRVVTHGADPTALLRLLIALRDICKRQNGEKKKGFNKKKMAISSKLAMLKLK